MRALHAASIFSAAFFASVACGHTSKHPVATIPPAQVSSTTSGCDDPGADDSIQAFGGATPLLAYTAVTTDGFTVWIVGPDGTQRRKIADNALQASWSP